MPTWPPHTPDSCTSYSCGASDAVVCCTYTLIRACTPGTVSKQLNLFGFNEQQAAGILAVFRNCTKHRDCLSRPALQVRNKTGITDIGLAANPGSYSFFARCAFDLDREKSIFMAFAGDSVSMTATDRLQRNTSLLQKLAETSST